MKAKYEILVDEGFDPTYGVPSYKVAKTFKGRKNEQSAISFISDIRNLRKYGCMSLQMHDEDGNAFTYDEELGEWRAMS